MRKLALVLGIFIGAPLVIAVGAASTAGIVSSMAGAPTTSSKPVPTITVTAPAETPSFKVTVPPVVEEPEVEVEIDIDKKVVPKPPVASEEKQKLKGQPMKPKVVKKKTEQPKAAKPVKIKKTSSPMKPRKTVKPKPVKTKTVRAGAFCSPAGATGVSSKGIRLTCKKSSGDTRNRWRR